MRGSGQLACCWVKSDSTVHLVVLQAAASAREQVQPAGGGRNLAGKLLQVEPIAGRGGGGPGAPAQAEVSAAYERVSCLRRAGPTCTGLLHTGHLHSMICTRI